MGIRDRIAGLARRVTRLDEWGRPLETRLNDLEVRLQRVESQAAEAILGVHTTQEAVHLAEASRVIPKRPKVLFVEAPAAYGNVAALARNVYREFGRESLGILARDELSAERWRAEGIDAHAWSTAPGVGAAPIWWEALTASVSVVEHHLWWRAPDRHILSALLAGSTQVQLWHGSQGAHGKEVALLTLPDSPGMWEFADIATTSVGSGILVCEPRLLEERREEFQFARAVMDVDYRMVAPLARVRSSGPRPERPRILVAPTYPETERGTEALRERLRTFLEASASGEADVSFRLHPWTPESVHADIPDDVLISQDVDIYDCLHEFDVLVTDFSSLSSDMLLLGRRVILDHSDADEYLRERRVRTDRAILECCDLVTSAREAVTQAADPRTDTRLDARRAHVARILDPLGAEPGRNTMTVIRELLGV